MSQRFARHGVLAESLRAPLAERGGKSSRIMRLHVPSSTHVNTSDMDSWSIEDPCQNRRNLPRPVVEARVCVDIRDTVPAPHIYLSSCGHCQKTESVLT